MIRLKRKLREFNEVNNILVKTKEGTVEISGKGIKATLLNKEAIISEKNHTSIFENVIELSEFFKYESGTYEVRSKKVEFINEAGQSIFAKKGDKILLSNKIITTNYGKHLLNPTSVCRNFTEETLLRSV